MNFTFEALITDNNLRLLISLVVSLVITWTSIPVIINICKITGLMENPIKRSSHNSPIPTFGGIGIFAGLLIGYMLWNFPEENGLMHRVFAGVVILFFLGLKDDVYALNAIKKLYSQVGTAALVIIGSGLTINHFFGIFGIEEIPQFLAIPFTLILFVTILNSFNLIDGVDGLSGGIGAIASGGFALWFALNEYWALACLGFCLSASLIAFLRFNFSISSKIFMGDTGSLIVGFVVAVLAIKFVSINTAQNFSQNSKLVNAPVVAITLLSVPIFDTLRVFGARILKGRSPFSPDRLHLHHLMVDNGLTHFATSFILSIFTVVLTLSAYFLRVYFTNTFLSICVLGIFAIYIGIGYWLEVRRLRKHKIKYGRKSKLTTAENLKKTFRAN